MKGLAYEFPLRPDFTAQLVLPYALTKQETVRLAAFLDTLVPATPDTLEGDRGEREPGKGNAGDRRTTGRLAAPHHTPNAPRRSRGQNARRDASRHAAGPR